MVDAFGIEIKIGDVVFIENHQKIYVKATVERLTPSKVICIYFDEAKLIKLSRYPNRVIVDMTRR